MKKKNNWRRCMDKYLHVARKKGGGGGATAPFLYITQPFPSISELGERPKYVCAPSPLFINTIQHPIIHSDIFLKIAVSFSRKLHITLIDCLVFYDVSTFQPCNKVLIKELWNIKLMHIQICEPILK